MRGFRCAFIDQEGTHFSLRTNSSLYLTCMLRPQYLDLPSKHAYGISMASAGCSCTHLGMPLLYEGIIFKFLFVISIRNAKGQESRQYMSRN